MKKAIVVSLCLFVVGCSDRINLPGDLNALKEGIELCESNGGVEVYDLWDGSGDGSDIYKITVTCNNGLVGNYYAKDVE